MALARLIDRRSLTRTLQVVLDDGQRPYNVMYEGRGFGWEGVGVDGLLVQRQTSLLWFVPRFEFDLGDHDAAIDVRVGPWLAIRSFRLSVDGWILYTEGNWPEL